MKIDVTAIASGVKKNTFDEHTGCPFWERFNSCRLESDIQCRYGLTEVNASKNCPLRIGVVVRLKRRKDVNHAQS